MQLSTGRILEENLVQSSFHQTLGDLIHLLAGQKPKTQGQIYTGVAYQEDSECS
jgi:hypothetical protein